MSPLSVLERLDTVIGVEGNMKNGNEEVAQVVRYSTALASLKCCVCVIDLSTFTQIMNCLFLMWFY